jgi:hypothetical protein
MSLGIVVTTVALVVGRAATAPAPSSLPVATAAQRASVAASIASQESSWRDQASDDFPADRWSQRDAFHGLEVDAVRRAASRFGVSYEDVFRAIDEDIHRSQKRERNADAVPCKPRPIYD